MFNYERNNTTYNTPSSDAIAQPVPSTTIFTLFPKLPLELRLQIWEFALPQPRVIEAYPHRDDNGQLLDNYASCRAIVVAPPAILHTNRESRILAQRTYTLAFNGPFREPIYFDFQRDTLLIQRWMSEFIRTEDVPKLRHLEIKACKMWLCWRLVEQRFHSLLFDKFCYLETLCILTHPDNYRYSNLVNDVENELEMELSDVRKERYSDERTVKKCKIEWRDLLE